MLQLAFEAKVPPFKVTTRLPDPSTDVTTVASGQVVVAVPSKTNPAGNVSINELVAVPASSAGKPLKIEIVAMDEPPDEMVVGEKLFTIPGSAFTAKVAVASFEFVMPWSVVIVPANISLTQLPEITEETLNSK